MEELQSTEILDREILEDARKKAARILKTCDETINSQNEQWKKKSEEAVSELKTKYDKQKKFETEKITARLPIDKLRIKIEKIENLLQSAEDAWFKDLGMARILKLLTAEFKKRLNFYGDFSASAQKQAFYSGIDKKEAETILKNANIACTAEKAASAGRYPSITLETENVRITASIQNIVEHYLHIKRTELTAALVGSDFLENV